MVIVKCEANSSRSKLIRIGSKCSLLDRFAKFESSKSIIVSKESLYDHASNNCIDWPKVNTWKVKVNYEMYRRKYEDEYKYLHDAVAIKLKT